MKRLPVILLVLGLIVCLAAPMVGLVGTVLAMTGAFQALGANGVSDPHALAAQIGTCLKLTMAGLIIAAGIGLPLVIAGFILLFQAGKSTPPQNSSPPVS